MTGNPNFQPVCAAGSRLPALPARVSRRAFTLVELLVVVAIIGIAMSMLLPAIQYSRNSVLRSQCDSNLRQVGLALFMYMDAHGEHSHFPACADMPLPGVTLPSLATVLAPYAENNPLMFQCPADLEYYAQIGISYEYPYTTLMNGTQMKTRQQLMGSNAGKNGASMTAILWDADNYHGSPGDDGARNFFFMDGHVEGTVPVPH